jgi:hypothetical protein
VKWAQPNQRSPRQLQRPLVRGPRSDISDRSIRMQTTPPDTLVISHSYAYMKWTPQQQVYPVSDRHASRCSRSFASQPVPPSLVQASRCTRSFPGQPASPLSLALVSQLLQELRPASCRRAGSQSPGYHNEDHWH